MALGASDAYAHGLQRTITNKERTKKETSTTFREQKKETNRKLKFSLKEAY